LELPTPRGDWASKWPKKVKRRMPNFISENHIEQALVQRLQHLRKKGSHVIPAGFRIVLRD